jgi:hypothetical protein
MASGVTNKGAYKILGWSLRQETMETNLYLALITNDNVPDVDTDTFGELTEIAAGNGYTTGGYQLTPNSTDFDVWTEDDVNDKGYIQLKDIVWTASGGSIPDTGTGAYYAVLLDDNGTIGSRKVYAWFELTGAPVSVSDGQTLTLPDVQIDATTT